MATAKEIRSRIDSIRDTQKITNAMYLIASTKLRRAKYDLNTTRPYFDALQVEIKRIFRTMPDIKSPFFYPDMTEHDLPGSYGYLVITADKGLAGLYNQNVLKEAMAQMAEHENPKLYVVGEYGRHYFEARGIPMEEKFLYTAQNPTIPRAREIASLLLEAYLTGKLSKIFVIYTDEESVLTSEAKTVRLLPFHRADFTSHPEEVEVKEPFDFRPSVKAVLDGIVPNYVGGFIYAALIASFSCEQQARMNAMDTANRNAEELLDELEIEYNEVRQSAITQEITEIAGAAKAMKRKQEERRARQNLAKQEKGGGA